MSDFPLIGLLSCLTDRRERQVPDIAFHRVRNDERAPTHMAPRSKPAGSCTMMRRSARSFSSSASCDEPVTFYALTASTVASSPAQRRPLSGRRRPALPHPKRQVPMKSFVAGQGGFLPTPRRCTIDRAGSGQICETAALRLCIPLRPKSSRRPDSLFLPAQRMLPSGATRCLDQQEYWLPSSSSRLLAIARRCDGSQFCTQACPSRSLHLSARPRFFRCRDVLRNSLHCARCDILPAEHDVGHNRYSAV